MQPGCPLITPIGSAGTTVHLYGDMVRHSRLDGVNDFGASVKQLEGAPQWRCTAPAQSEVLSAHAPPHSERGYCGCAHFLFLFGFRMLTKYCLLVLNSVGTIKRFSSVICNIYIHFF